MRKRWWYLYALLIAGTILVAAQSDTGTVHHRYLWDDPNGVEQEMWVGTEGEFVFITVCGAESVSTSGDDMTVWLSWNNAKAVSRGLDEAWQTAHYNDNGYRYDERR